MINPADIEGLIGHWTTRGMALSDGASVTTWENQAGDVDLVKQNAGTVTFRADVLNGHGVINVPSASSTYLLASALFPGDVGQNFTIIGVQRVLAAGSQPYYIGTNARSQGGTLDPQGYQWTNGTGGYAQVPAGAHQTEFFPTVLACNANGGTYPLSSCNLSNGFGPLWRWNGGGTSPNGLGLELARTSSVMEYAEVCVYRRRLTWTEMWEAQKWLCHEFGLYDWTEDAEAVVILEGNSTFQRGLAYKLGVELNLPCFQHAQAGGTLSTLQGHSGEILEHCDYWRSRGKKVVLGLFHGHNEGSATNIQDGYKIADFQTARAHGAHLLAVGQTCRYTNSAYETYRQTAITWLQGTEGQGYIDQFTDVLSSSAEFGVYGDGTAYSDPDRTGSWKDFASLWVDNVHMSTTGEDLAAEMLAPVVLSAIEDAPEFPSPGAAEADDVSSTAAVLTSGAASGSRGSFTYQWQRLIDDDWEDVEGEVSLTLELTGLTPETDYSYRLAANDGFLTVYGDPVAFTTLEDASGDETPPEVESATVPSSGLYLDLSLSEPILPASGISGFTAKVDAASKSVAITRPATQTIRLTFDSPVLAGQTVTYSYTPGNVEDEAGNALAAIADAAATNESAVEPDPGDVTAPTVQSASIPSSGAKVVATLSEDTTGDAGFILKRNGSSVSFTPSRANATTLEFTPSTGTIYDDDVFTLGYNGVSGDVEDLAGNPMATFADMAVANNSTQQQGGGGDVSWQYVNGARTTAAVTRGEGGTTLVLADATRFARTAEPLSPDKPMKISAWTAQGAFITLLKATGLSGSTLTIDGVLEGEDDATIPAGSIICNGFTAGDAAALQGGGS